MAKLGIITGKAPSLKVVANDISTVFKEEGVPNSIYYMPVPEFEAVYQFDKSIIFMPFDPSYAIPYFLIYREYGRKGIDRVFYTTIEGYVIRQMLPDWVKRDVEVIAVSNYVREKLEEAGINVLDVIHHGIDTKQLKDIIPKKDAVRKMTGGKVVFGTIASSHKRKGLDLLASAISLIQEKIDAGFYILTQPDARPLFSGLKNVYVDVLFGRYTRLELLRLISSFDFYICSSLSEGFGLPLIEAQAFGIPVIYPDYAPLNEFMNPNINFPFQWESIEEYEDKFGIRFELHIYKPESLAEKIVEAYNLHASNNDEYKKITVKAKRYVSEKYDIRKHYPNFKKYLKL
jgi:glycosyltransferase involved in cell wall biosynthesis